MKCLKAYLPSCIGRSWCMLAIATVLFTAVACKEKSDNPDLVVKHLKQAEFYLKQGQYKAANIEVRNVMQKDPRNIEGVLLGAKIMAALGFHAQVIETLSSLEDKVEADGLFLLAEAYLGRTKFRSAMDLLERQSKILKQSDAARFYTIQAEALLGRGQYQEALLTYRRALSSNEKFVQAAIGEIKALTVLEQLKERDEKLKKLKADAPNDADVLILDARIRVAEGELEKAESALTQALSVLPSTDEMTPRRASVINLLADILSRQKRSAEALRYSRILSEAYPGMDEAQGSYQQALTLFRESKIEEAESVLQTVLEQSPQFEAAAQLLGVINFLQGDFQEADQLFADALDPELASDQVKQVYALNSMRLQRPKEVLSVLEEGIEDSRNPRLWAMYGVALQSVGRMDDAINALRQSLKLDDKQARVHLVLAQYLAGKAEPEVEESLAYFQQAYKLAPSDPLVQQNLLQYYVRANDRSAANAFVEKIRKDAKQKADDTNPETWVLLGDYALFQGQTAQAMTYFKNAKDSAQAAAKLALTLARDGKMADAQDLCRDWQKREPGALWPYRCLLGLTDKDPAAKRRLVQAFEKQSAQSDGELSAPLVALGYQALNDARLNPSSIDTAIGYAKKAKAFAIEHPELDRLVAASHYAKATLALQSKKYDEARTAILSGLQAAPESAPLLIALADVEVSSGNLAEAKKIVEQVKTIDNATGLHLEGDLSLSQQQFKQAQKSYNEAWNLRPSDDLGAQLYRTYLALEQSNRANTLLRSWLKLFPNSARARAISGNQYLSTNDYEGAAKEFELGLQGSPNSVVLLNNLAWVQQQRKQPNAEALAEKAASLAPGSAAVLDTYGWILFENGKTKQALPILEKAYELAPDNAEIEAHLIRARKAK